MHHKPSVLVQVDLDGRHIRLVVSGCVTELNHRALCPLVRRARTLAPDIAVVVDLTSAHHVEPAAVDLLRWAADQDESLGDAVEILAPETAPAEPAVAALEGRRRLRSRVLQRRSAELPVPLPELALDAAS